VACEDEAVARRVQEALSVPTMRLYTNTDVIGVEVGGALKNVIAIAAGVVDGFDLGTNAKAGLMTRGLAEMTRMAVAKGAQAITLSGLAGMGDLVATCYSSLSRNYRLGYRVARGDSVETAQRELGATAEGITTARAVCELSKKLGIELPIAQQVDMTLRGLSAPKQAIMSLMTRPLASE
jgi:glycerol-3-phosphate dehydrogenase (NAD(P)+)